MAQQVEKDILSNLIKSARAAVEIVRKKQGPTPYDDQTGNLNSSTGFIIQHNGKIVHTDFRKSAKGTDKDTGIKIGKEVAKREMLDNDGWGIVIVAGMYYASWVQGNHNRDVLASASNELPSKLSESLKRLDKEQYS